MVVLHVDHDIYDHDEHAEHLQLTHTCLCTTYKGCIWHECVVCPSVC